MPADESSDRCHRSKKRRHIFWRAIRHVFGSCRHLAVCAPTLTVDNPASNPPAEQECECANWLSCRHRGLKLTIVMITHDLDTLLATCSRVAVLVDRKIVVDTLGGIMNNPHPWIQEYFHGPRSRAAQAAGVD